MDNIKNNRKQILTLRDPRLVGNHQDKLKLQDCQSSSKAENFSNEPQRSSMEFESNQPNSLQNTNSNSFGSPNSSSKQTEEENCSNISEQNNRNISMYTENTIQCSSDTNSRSSRDSYEEMETSDSENLQLNSCYKGNIT